MSFSTLPTSIKSYIFDFAMPSVINNKEIEGAKSNMKLNREIASICRPQIQKINEMKHFYNKYHVYNKEHEDQFRPWSYEKNSQENNPQLLDALFAGCTLPCTKSSVEEYTPEVENDIMRIVKLFPRSIHFDNGQMRCRRYVTPLAAACHNENIPPKIIDFLLKNGASSSTTIYLEPSTEYISLLEDLRNHVKGESSRRRFETIEKLFNKHKAK